ncbi:uncharacterized protein [Apostichopus japonicus]|uniref:uncharacterized protein n=1 Tax=Stichopus japonicus TaxID=307972 RepID=UPI003AB18F44
MYEGIKKAAGPAVKKTAPLKAKSGQVITDRRKQLERWVEHYYELYSTENTVSEEVINNIPALPTLDELDKEPTASELEKAINGLASGQAPGNDAIPPEITKKGKPALAPSLRTPLSLLEGRVALNRLQTLADRVYPESQCGFRSGRSTTDMIFCVRQLEEKCRVQRQPLYVAFVDLTKTFDLVSRSGLLKLLQRIGCPPILLSIIMLFHNNMKGTKTEVMTQDAPIPPIISVNDFRLETVDNFRYLGSIISSNVSLDAEINAGIGNAAAVMSKLQKRV